MTCGHHSYNSESLSFSSPADGFAFETDTTRKKISGLHLIRSNKLLSQLTFRKRCDSASQVFPERETEPGSEFGFTSELDMHRLRHPAQGQ
jgi:hypothetical protein